MGGKKKYINIFGSFTEPFNYQSWRVTKNGDTPHWQWCAWLSLERCHAVFYAQSSGTSRRDYESFPPVVPAAGPATTCRPYSVKPKLSNVIRTSLTNVINLLINNRIKLFTEKCLQKITFIEKHYPFSTSDEWQLHFQHILNRFQMLLRFRNHHYLSFKCTIMFHFIKHYGDSKSCIQY